MFLIQNKIQIELKMQLFGLPHRSSYLSVVKIVFIDKSKGKSNQMQNEYSSQLISLKIFRINLWSSTKHFQIHSIFRLNYKFTHIRADLTYRHTVSRCAYKSLILWFNVNNRINHFEHIEHIVSLAIPFVSRCFIFVFVVLSGARVRYAFSRTTNVHKLTSPQIHKTTYIR